jgi:hypothetical protein
MEPGHEAREDQYFIAGSPAMLLPQWSRVTNPLLRSETDWCPSLASTSFARVQIALQIPQIGVDRPAEAATVADMEKPVQWMTLQELRDELERTRPAWEAGVAHLDGVFADGPLPALGEEAHRHQLVENELLRRPRDR